MRLFPMLVTGAALAVAPLTMHTAFAQDAPAPEAASVVEKTVASLQKISAVSYHARLSAGGAIEGQAPTIEGKVLLEGRPEGDIPLVFRGEGTITAPDGSSTEKFLSSFDGDSAFGVNYDERVLYTGELGAGGLDLLTGTLELLVDAFVVDDPMLEERNAFATTLLDNAEVGGVECRVVQFQYAESAEGGMSRWFIGVEDNLPRRIQRLLMIPAGEATITYELTELNTSPDVADDAFAIAALEGFGVESYDTSGLLPIGSVAPDFTLRNDDGEDVTLSELRGQVVVLDFWATWCGPCKVAMPGVQELHEEFADQPVQIFGVNCWEQGPSEAA
ncbi:MAG: peroxiredoxin family protein, partial [Phycisphaerales bacterium]